MMNLPTMNLPMINLQRILHNHNLLHYSFVQTNHSHFTKLLACYFQATRLFQISECDKFPDFFRIDI